MPSCLWVAENVRPDDRYARRAEARFPLVQSSREEGAAHQPPQSDSAVVANLRGQRDLVSVPPRPLGLVMMTDEGVTGLRG